MGCHWRVMSKYHACANGRRDNGRLRTLRPSSELNRQEEAGEEQNSRRSRVCSAHGGRKITAGSLPDTTFLLPPTAFHISRRGMGMFAHRGKFLRDGARLNKVQTEMLVNLQQLPAQSSQCQ